jgi:hypothetical protein
MGKGDGGQASAAVPLRDYFAAAMLTGVASGIQNAGQATKEERNVLFRQVADIMYEMADQMLAAREAKP